MDTRWTAHQHNMNKTPKMIIEFREKMRRGRNKVEQLYNFSFKQGPANNKNILAATIKEYREFKNNVYKNNTDEIINKAERYNRAKVNRNNRVLKCLEFK